MLRGAMGLGRVASSYLFQGESGIGKRFTALNFVKALNCLTPTGDGDACDACASCTKLDGGTHPDFVVIEPEGSYIKVGAIIRKRAKRGSKSKERDEDDNEKGKKDSEENKRSADEILSLKSFEARVKAIIVDNAEQMNMEASNAFLKIFEEPPPNSIIILVSSSPDRLPETIRSRANRVNFTPLGEDDCIRLLKLKLGGDADMKTLARLSMGRPGLAIADDLVGRRDGFFEALGEMLGGAGKPTWADMAEIEEWFDTAFIVLRDIAAIKLSGKGSRPHIINEDIRDDLVRMADRADLKVIIESYGKLTVLRRYMAFNLNKAITWNYVGILWRKTGIGEM